MYIKRLDDDIMIFVSHHGPRYGYLLRLVNVLLRQDYALLGQSHDMLHPTYMPQKPLDYIRLFPPKGWDLGVRLEGSRCQTTLCMYSGTSLIRTPLGPSFSGRIIEVSSFQGLLI
jgi:hypothetical protein